MIEQKVVTDGQVSVPEAGRTRELEARYVELLEKRIATLELLLKDKEQFVSLVYALLNSRYSSNLW